MKEFEIDLGFDGGVQFEPTSNSQGNTINESQLTDVKPVEATISKDFIKIGFDGETTTDTETKKSWTDTLNTLTQQFKDITDYKTNEQAQAEKEQEIAEKGTTHKIFGMNPFVAIGLSLVVIIGGSYALTKIKAG